MVTLGVRLVPRVCGKLDKHCISSSLGHVGGQNQCIMYLDKYCITVRNVSMNVEEI
jgi:hypothetical protein